MTLREPNPKVTAGVLAVVVAAACLLAYAAAVGVAAGQQQVELVDSSEVEQTEQPNEVRYVVTDSVWIESYRYEGGDLHVRLQATRGGQQVQVKDQLSRFDKDSPGYHELVTLQEGTTEVVVPDVGLLQAPGVIGTTDLFTVTVANPTNDQEIAIITDSPGISWTPPNPGSALTFVLSSFGVFFAMLAGSIYTLSTWENRPRVYDIKPKRPITPWTLEWPYHHAAVAVASAVGVAGWLALYRYGLTSEAARGSLLVGTAAAILGLLGGVALYLVRTNPDAFPVTKVDEDADVLDIVMPNPAAWTEAEVEGDVPRPRKPEQAEGYDRVFVVSELDVPDDARETPMRIRGTWRGTKPVDMVEASLEWLTDFRIMERKAKLVPKLKAMVSRARREGVYEGVRIAGRASDKLTTGDTEVWDEFSDEMQEWMQEMEQAEDERDDTAALRDAQDADSADDDAVASIEELAEEAGVDLANTEADGDG